MDNKRRRKRIVDIYADLSVADAASIDALRQALKVEGFYEDVDSKGE